MMNEGSKNILDAASLGVVVSSLASWLPPVAALLTVSWTSIRIYETRTVQEMLRRRNFIRPKK